MSFDYICAKYAGVVQSLASGSRPLEKRLVNAWELLSRLGLGGEWGRFPTAELQGRHDSVLEQLQQRSWKDAFEARRVVEAILSIHWELTRIEGARDTHEYALILEGMDG